MVPLEAKMKIGGDNSDSICNNMRKKNGSDSEVGVRGRESGAMYEICR